MVFYNRLAEVVGEYLKKGSQIYIEGRLQTRKWTDKAGVERYSTEIIATEMQMLGSKPAGGSVASAASPGNQPQQQAPADDVYSDVPF